MGLHGTCGGDKTPQKSLYNWEKEMGAPGEIQEVREESKIRKGKRSNKTMDFHVQHDPL